MVIHLRHPIHGTKVAISNTEAEADEKNGWVRYDVGVLLTPTEAVDESVNVLAAKRPPGRPRKEVMEI